MASLSFYSSSAVYVDHLTSIIEKYTKFPRKCSKVQVSQSLPPSSGVLLNRKRDPVGRARGVVDVCGLLSASRLTKPPLYQYAALRDADDDDDRRDEMRRQDRIWTGS